MATLAVTTLAAATAVNPNAGGAAADAGLADEFANTGKELLVVANGGASICNVGVESTVQVDGQAVANRSYAVPVGETRVLGPFAPGIYNDADGNVQVTYDQIDTVTVKVLQLLPS